MHTKKYSLSDKAAKRVIFGLLLFTLIGVGLAFALVKLGLPNWKIAQYKVVNIGLLAMCVAGVTLNVMCGSILPGRRNQLRKSLILSGVSLVVAVVLWVVMTIIDKHHSFGVVFFLLGIALVVLLFVRLFQLVKHMWHVLNSDSHDNGEAIAYPGDYVLTEVQCGTGLTSPFGKVLIFGNAVLFVNVNRFRGFVEVSPNGYLEVKRYKGMSETNAEVDSLSTSELNLDGAMGIDRVIDIVRRECEARGIDAPDMIYDYAVFLPRFQQGNFVYMEHEYDAVPWHEKVGSYKKYLKKASVSYFNQKTCFNPRHLELMLRKMNAEYNRTHASGKGNGALVAECIAKACELNEVKK